MQLRIALAGAIRALRKQRQLRHEDLSDASVKSKLSALERGETSITLEKFESLSEGLRISPLALLALCMSQQLDTPYPLLIEAALKQLRVFEKEGGLGILAEQLTDGGVAHRKPGKPQNVGSESVVRELKIAGMNQSQIARETGLALSTVHRYWKRINAGNSDAGEAFSDD